MGNISCLSDQENMLTRIDPETECQIVATAATTAASALLGKNLVLNPVARPAFCTPTSIAKVRFLSLSIPAIVPEKL